MTIYECRTCGHIEFNEVPEKCLVCRSPQTVFHENPDAIKKPADPAGLTDGDKKHVPVLHVTDCGLLTGCKDVHVTVGDIEHVMDPKHYILYVDFYLDYRFISRVWLAPSVCKPAASIHLAVQSGTVTAIESCNVHGNWMGEIQL
ncbi:MAG: desulfoferrodoxin family protein [Kiritimatiellia bacterium]